MAAKVRPLAVRLLADTSGERPKDDDGNLLAWPRAGVEVGTGIDPSSAPPKRTRVPTSWVRRGVSEGWIAVTGEAVKHEPGGPPEDPWRVTHTFPLCDTVAIGEADPTETIRYRVVHQPGVYDDPGEPGGKRVDWFYELELEG